MKNSSETSSGGPPVPPGGALRHEGANAILQAADLGRRFYRRKGFLDYEAFFAVRALDLAIRPGEVVAIIGESGCGKTTLSRMLIGMLRTTQGCVQAPIGGQWCDVSSLSAAEKRVFRRNVQMVYQESDLALDPMSPVLESVQEGYRVNWPDLSRPKARRLSMRLLHELGLEPRGWRSLPGSMSGGERKRAVIARAFAALGYGLDRSQGEPDPLPGRLLIADEPTAGLDCATQARLLLFFRQRQQEMGLAYLLISHDLAIVRAFANRVMVMFGGRAVERGTVESLWPPVPRRSNEGGAARGALGGRGGAGFMHPYSRELIGVLSSNVDQPALPNPRNEGCAFLDECPHKESQCKGPQAWHAASGARGDSAPEHQWACWKAERIAPEPKE